MKAEKCTFHAMSVTFLGSVVSADGISMEPVKIQAIIDWHIPESRTAPTISGLCTFLLTVHQKFQSSSHPFNRTHLDQVLLCLVGGGPAHV